MICPLSLAHFVALGAFQIAAVLLFIKVDLVPVPLCIFVLLCVIMPFFHRFSFFLPIISKGVKGAKGVALTFDDGPDPELTPLLLELLAQHGIVATFFVTGARATRYPNIIKVILANGHAIGNHSYSHDPFLMFRGRSRLQHEIASTQSVLKQFGIVPLVFRPPVGITNSRLWRVLLENGMFCVNFSCRAVDFGNRQVRGLAQKILSKSGPGDIILLHDVVSQQTDASYLLREFTAIIAGLQEKGLEIQSLAQLIGQEIMQMDTSGSALNPAELFYNGLAATYDNEQFSSKVSLSRSTEYRLFSAQLPTLFAQEGRVLEIGAGTGIFTLDLARRCRDVLALDISGNMLELLKEKALREGVTNIRCLRGNAETIELPGRFSAVCAFSALEYLTDLPAFFVKTARHMEPGGVIYLITARTSLFRFFTQVGNAMRQGIWLKSHSRRQIVSMLSAAGFERIIITSHLLKSIISGGMLLEVVAHKGVGVSICTDSAVTGGGDA
jgi:peptidoglycan/xylan/chitin deacetylase (PgdA/CDA1 family)/2-polyprenyl-3-methyl-5-hydroxy-6-metoxy-1,4-benzoquinol methylase